MNKALIIRWIENIPLVPNILRWYARRFHEGSVVTIKNGYASGFKWKRHHRHVNGYWIGHYELPIQEAIVRELSDGDTIFDVGVNAGFFVLVAAKKVGPNGKVVAFEPLLDNAESITEQIELNNLENCHLVQEALWDSEGTARFSYDVSGSSTAHLGNARYGEKTIEVKLNTLDKMVKIWGVPKLVKIDIEGAEVNALKGATWLLEEIYPTFLIELHGPKCETGVSEILYDAGYSLYDLIGRKLGLSQKMPSHIIAKK